MALAAVVGDRGVGLKNAFWRSANSPSTAVPSPASLVSIGGSSSSAEGCEQEEQLPAVQAVAPHGPATPLAAREKLIAPPVTEDEASDEDVPAGQPQPPAIPSIELLAAENTVKGLDRMLSRAVKEYNEKGFDQFNSFLTDEIEKLGYVSNVESERQANGGRHANIDGNANQEVHDFVNDHEKLFKDASETASFDMKSKVGQWWTREVKADKRLGESYASVGRSYDAQRRFRKEWAARKFLAARTTRLKEEKQSFKVGLS
jgi:hypothetical protein